MNNVIPKLKKIHSKELTTIIGGHRHSLAYRIAYATGEISDFFNF